MDKKLRVWHIPQIQMKSFYVDVQSIEEAWKIINVLWDYDLFQYENKVRDDYTNISGLLCWDDLAGDWFEWHDEDGCGIMEHFQNLEE